MGHNTDRLRVFDLDTGEERALQHSEMRYGEYPSWSADGRGIFVDGGWVTRGRLMRGLVYVSMEDGSAVSLRLNWGEWDVNPVPSPDGTRLAFGANYFYDGNAWMIERR